MNYLAHAYLSFDQPGILVGNMISDFVKGKKRFDYSPAIQNGITLHRAIDTFTDYHPATSQAKKFFQPVYRLYSAVFMDIVYDHFLATDETIFPDPQSLAVFAKRTYASLSDHEDAFPEHFKWMFPYMKRHDWLYNYRYREGIYNSFNGIVRRSKYLTESEIAFEIFETNYGALKEGYDAFFPSLREFTLTHLQLLRN